MGGHPCVRALAHLFCKSTWDASLSRTLYFPPLPTNPEDTQLIDTMVIAKNEGAYLTAQF